MPPNPDGSLTPEEVAAIQAQALEDATRKAVDNQIAAQAALAAEAARQNGNG